MTGRDIRETERNVRSLDFLETHKNDFSAIPYLIEQITGLRPRVENVRKTYEKQIGKNEAVRQDYDEVRDVYAELLAAVREVADFAVSIAKKEKGFNELFPYPSGSGKRRLIAETRTIADNAEPNLAKFTKLGMEETFPADLRDLADRLEKALNNAAATTGERVGATDNLSKEVAAASDIIEEISPAIKKVYKNDPENLAAWKFASKVEKHTPKPREPKS